MMSPARMWSLMAATRRRNSASVSVGVSSGVPFTGPGGRRTRGAAIFSRTRSSRDPASAQACSGLARGKVIATSSRVCRALSKMRTSPGIMKQASGLSAGQRWGICSRNDTISC